MSGFFGAVSKDDCVSDVFYGTDYHSHLGTKRGGMAVYCDKIGFQRAIHSLEIISIRLDSDDNPQLIFESLNSTGLDLSEGDKIRNYILMGQPSKQQEVYYEKYWNMVLYIRNLNCFRHRLLIYL